jgi:hypothetical protein
MAANRLVRTFAEVTPPSHKPSACKQRWQPGTHQVEAHGVEDLDEHGDCDNPAANPEEACQKADQRSGGQQGHPDGRWIGRKQVGQAASAMVDIACAPTGEQTPRPM